MKRGIPSVLLAGALALISCGAARAQDAEPKPQNPEPKPQNPEPPPYKDGEWWPLRVANGFDFVEAIVPAAAARNGDWGRIVLNSMLPLSMFAASFDDGIDRSTLKEIGRWKWAGIDESKDNYPMLFALVGIGGLSTFLPAPVEDADGYSWGLRLDRLTVFALGVGLANAEVELLKPVIGRTRPNGHSGTSDPSGHAATAFASMAFLSDVLRDTLRPQEESNIPLRILKEGLTAVPYLGGFYMAFERIHGKKHFLTDTLLGGAIGIVTTHFFYAWSFTKVEQGRGWLDSFTMAYDPSRKTFELAFARDF
jgi:membrane-associated phospholipid phosphatase